MRKTNIRALPDRNLEAVIESGVDQREKDKCRALVRMYGIH